MITMWVNKACMLLVLCVLIACGDNSSSVKPEPEPTPAPAPVPAPTPAPAPERTPVGKTPRTVILYMAGDNSLSFLLKPDGSSGDFAELLEGASQMDPSMFNANHVLVFADKSDADFLPTIWHLGLSADGTPMLKEVKKFDTDVMSTDPAVIKEVVNFATNNYPANSYGFVYWSHGEGWQFIGVDQQNGTLDSKKRGQTTIPDFASALASVGQKFDFVMFDACYMLSLEVAYELRNCTNYIIAAPTETPGPGAPYNTILAAMLSDDNLPVAMGNAFYSYYAERYDGANNGIPTNDSWHGGVSVGVVDCGQLDALAKATAQGLQGVTGVDYVALREKIFAYDRRNFVNLHYYFDTVDIMKTLMSEEAFTAWKKAYDYALVAWNTTPKYYSSATRWFPMDTAHGLTHYIPRTSDLSTETDKAYHATSWYKDVGLSQLGW